MIILKLITAFLVGSGLDTAIIKLMFSAYVIFEFYFVFRSVSKKISKFAWYLLIFFMLGLINMIIFLLFLDYPVSYEEVVLRARFYFIELLFGFSVYLFFKNRTKKDLLDVLLLSLIFNSIAGVIQFAMNPSGRTQMLFSEPSAAGFYYCFVIFIVLANYKDSKLRFLISRFYSFLGILIFSKGQFLALGLVQIFKASKKAKLAIVGILVIVITLYIDYIRLIGDKFDQIVNLYEQLTKHGIEGLNEKYKVWSSFVTRISSIYVSLLSLIDYPNGLGFGGFHGYYVDWVKHSGIDIASNETDEIAQGVRYASPRSHLLELFLSTGIIGVILYIKMFISFLKRGRKDYLYVAFLSLTIVAFILELNPFFCYIALLIALREKEVESKMLVTNRVI